MTTLAEPRRAGRPPRVAQLERPARGAVERAPRKGRTLTGGIAGIVGIASFMALLVALNVGVLELNGDLDRLARERADLRAGIASTQAQLSTAASNQRIAAGAHARLGLVPADPELTIYVSLR